MLNGTNYGDTYRVGLGDGNDTLNDHSTTNSSTGGYADRMEFGEGIVAQDLSLIRDGDDLLISHVNGTDSIRVIGWFASSRNQIELVTFADGTQWTREQIMAMVPSYGTEGDDVFTGLDSNNETFYGLGGNDTINGGYGNDVLDGGDGADVLNGGRGCDEFRGGAGNDVLGGTDTDEFSGSYSGSTYGNVYEGGTGDDVLNGTYYSDTYRFGLGDGHDTLNDHTTTYSTTSYYADRLEFGEGVAASDLSLSREGDDLLISHANGTDSVRVTGWFTSTLNQIEVVTFVDGTQWTREQITDWVPAYGTDGDDVLTGTAGDNVLFGLAGQDSLNGGAGADILNGGTGGDTLAGGEGSDRYSFALGDGEDVIVETDSSGSSEDVIEFGDGIQKESIWFSRSGDDLAIDYGTGDHITVGNWYTDQSHQVECIEIGDGSQLFATQLEQLVAAMAAFDPPVGGEMNLTAQEEEQVNAAIAAAWQ